MTLPLTRLARDVYSPVTAGGADRGADMGEAQAYHTEIERIIELAIASDLLVYTSKASLDADLAHAAHTGAVVIGDATSANNGLYMKSGASGSGSWTRIADVPGYPFQVAVNAGGGTANAIVATTPLPVTSEQLIALPIAVTTTSAFVSVALNGGAALSIKTASGNNPVSGGLIAGMVVVGFKSGSTFRLLTDQATAAIQAEIENIIASATGSTTLVDDGEITLPATSANIILKPATPSARFVNLPPDAMTPIRVWDGLGDSAGGWGTYAQTFRVSGGTINGRSTWPGETDFGSIVFQPTGDGNYLAG
ncbi:hypothetical protein RA307_23680 [Xanthobacteraceae bacterium Astr-EGSB]|uniref:hypothetical protein n=1 Tax=Astrobacterium formosum TaxID=3069710 RepID=UPI0027B63A07|nr:hypothetical protein [Xanthobacteraceae bacterium Astr-EGSB]